MIRISVDFHDERDFPREKVRDELVNDLLSPKGNAQALTTKSGPE